MHRTCAVYYEGKAGGHRSKAHELRQPLDRLTPAAPLKVQSDADGWGRQATVKVGGCLDAARQITPKVLTNVRTRTSAGLAWG